MSDLPDGSGGVTALDTGHEWRCPFCGQSRLNASNGGEGRKNAISALRTHIVASDGAEHGPRNEFPAEFDTLSLDDHVVEVDGKESSDQ